MKLSFVTFACPHWPWEQVLEEAVRFGYQGVEFRCDAQQGHGVEVSMAHRDRMEVVNAFHRHELEAVCLATSLQLMEPMNRRMNEERLVLADDIGCKAIRVFCGAAPARMGQGEVIELLGERMHELGELARQHDVEVWLKMHDVMSYGADAAKAVEIAGLPNVGISYDCLHSFRMGEDLKAGFEAVKPWVKHMSLHDGLEMPDRVEVTPMGEGDVPMRRVFDLLGEFKGYDGFVCGEWFYDQYGSSPESSLGRFVSDIREFEG